MTNQDQWEQISPHQREETIFCRLTRGLPLKETVRGWPAAGQQAYRTDVWWRKMFLHRPGGLQSPNAYSIRALTTYRTELVIAKQKVSSKLLSSYGRKNSLWISISSSYLWHFFTVSLFKFAAQITKRDTACHPRSRRSQPADAPLPSTALTDRGVAMAQLLPRHVHTCIRDKICAQNTQRDAECDQLQRQEDLCESRREPGVLLEIKLDSSLNSCLLWNKYLCLLDKNHAAIQ